MVLPVAFRPFVLDDLCLMRGWLAQPHVARWWLPGTDLEAEVERFAAKARGSKKGRFLIAESYHEPLGYAQWYDCADYPTFVDGAFEPNSVGIDYFVGRPEMVGTGAGTAMIGRLVEEIAVARPGAAVMANPHSSNAASWRVLEKNGFQLTDVRRLDSEDGPGPWAIYVLPAAKAEKL